MPKHLVQGRWDLGRTGDWVPAGWLCEQCGRWEVAGEVKGDRERRRAPLCRPGAPVPPRAIGALTPCLLGVGPGAVTRAINVAASRHLGPMFSTLGALGALMAFWAAIVGVAGQAVDEANRDFHVR